ncbi:hypothetical protein [Streptococcus dysgalactiae]|uniref:Uncharacterized protein n=1 Tax=Streptococcus dysgalactiae TaxID=1334 RepID=A0A9X9SHZ6_STRDY|nr:hypothetical protein [Streptococcus dysgalactiae]VTS48867.1 Uncharacterised protein [Streptococcus dysgalactiae subsp. equisimilis]VTS50102.1 Uncharacterised protein [Streptococcus dysgalactiae subsp. equisimilis]VTS78088.1 Uncharacterised protein [Streptococcus dysgalactiae]
MKKKLVLATALLTVGVATNVKAEEERASEHETLSTQVDQKMDSETLKWVVDPDHPKVKDDNNDPIPVNIDNDKITVQLPQGWSLWLEKDGRDYSPLEINSINLETHKKRYKGTSDYSKNTSPKVLFQETNDDSEDENLKFSFIYNDNQGFTRLPLTIKVGGPTGESKETLKLLYRTDYNYLAGSTIFKDSQTINKEQEENKVSDSKQSIAENQLQQSNQDSTSQDENNLEQNHEEGDNSWVSYLKVKAQKTWTNLKYYCNPMNWFGRWGS